MRFKGKKIAITHEAKQLVFREFFRGLNVTRGCEYTRRRGESRIGIRCSSKKELGTIIRWTSWKRDKTRAWIINMDRIGYFPAEDAQQEYTEFVYKLVRCSLLVGERYSSFSAGTKVS